MDPPEHGLGGVEERRTMNTETLLRTLAARSTSGRTRLTVSGMPLFLAPVLSQAGWYLSALIIPPFVPTSWSQSLFGVVGSLFFCWLLLRSRRFYTLVLEGRRIDAGDGWSFDVDEVTSAEVSLGVLTLKLKSGARVEGWTPLRGVNFHRTADGAATNDGVGAAAVPESVRVCEDQRL
jgi:hypothetical protein